MDMTLIRNR